MSTVILDTITGKSTATTITIGSTPVVSASANSMTIRGEGSAQTSIQQGLTKHFVNLDGTASSDYVRDSFNNTSITDGGTGDYKCVFTNAMASNGYVHTVAAGSGSGHTATLYSLGQNLTVSCRIYVLEHASGVGVTDDVLVVGEVSGDLA